MASKIDLISNALILIGDTPINALTGGSRRETVANNLYDNIVKRGFKTSRCDLCNIICNLIKRKAHCN